MIVRGIVIKDGVETIEYEIEDTSNMTSNIQIETA
jgi:hypothetical protein